MIGGLTEIKGTDMKLMQKVRMSTLGAALLMLTGVAGAQESTPNDASYTHGNVCYGGGVTPTQYGVYNPSTTNSATVTCPLTAVWPQFASGWNRWLQLSYYNRSNVAGSFTCKLYGLADNGSVVWNPSTVTIPTGSVGSSVQQLNVGQPPASALFFTMSCTIPKTTGSGSGHSYVTAISVKIGS
jgi:hypothetical protein